MRRSAVVLAASVGCVGCGGLFEPVAPTDGGQAPAAEAGADRTMDVDVDGANGVTTVKTADGFAEVGANAKLPEDLPIVLPPGAWQTQMVVSTPGGTTVAVKPPVGSAALDVYFKGELARLGCATPDFAELPGMMRWQCAGLPGFESVQVVFVGEGADQVVQVVYKRTGAASPGTGTAPATPAQGAP